MSNQARSPRDDELAGRAAESAESGQLDQIRMAIKGIRYGEVRVVIQDGVVVQIERLEKQRLR